MPYPDDFKSHHLEGAPIWKLRQIERDEDHFEQLADIKKSFLDFVELFKISRKALCKKSDIEIQSAIIAMEQELDDLLLDDVNDLSLEESELPKSKEYSAWLQTFKVGA